MGNKTKYHPSFPLLAESMARAGYTDKEMADALKISRQSFSTYQDKYPEFREAVQNGKLPANFIVEGAIFRRAVGYDYEEVTIEETVSETGERTGNAVRKTVRKHLPADVGAAWGWLFNRAPKRWVDRKFIHLKDDKAQQDTLRSIDEKLNSMKIDQIRQLAYGETVKDAASSDK